MDFKVLERMAAAGIAEEVTGMTVWKGDAAMEITEKVAYLKGLAEGLKLDTETKEGKLLSVMIDLLDDIALEMQDQQDQISELADGLDAVSEDLEDVESLVYDDEDGEDGDESEDCYTVVCPDCGEQIFFDASILNEGEVRCPHCGTEMEFGGLDDTDVQYTVACPNCEESIVFDQSVLDGGEVCCPNCGEKLEFNGIVESDTEE